MVFVIYAGAAVLALALLYFFRTHWIWHVLSVALALALGVVPADRLPLPMSWGTGRDVVTGSVFMFLMVWGLGAPLFHRHHHRETPHAPSARA